MMPMTSSNVEPHTSVPTYLSSIWQLRLGSSKGFGTTVLYPSENSL